MGERTQLSLTSPVERGPEEDAREPDDGAALCLSGGGFRAMLFHAGVVLRLGELGLLPKLRRISSVSGGSIAAGLLGLRWKQLAFDASGVPTAIQEVFVQPLCQLAGRTIDVKAVAVGAAWFGSIADHVAENYKKHLVGDATLQDLPGDGEGPRFVINATNVQTGSLWRFSRPFMGDYQVGRVFEPTLSLAVAIAASSAFPPFLSPLELELEPGQVVSEPNARLAQPPFTTQIILTDGGVYDNLGLETAWKRYRTILVSDGGGQTAPEGDPKRDWPRHAFRVLNLIDNQVRALRKRQVLSGFRAPVGDENHRAGAYWGIRTDIQRYPIADALKVPCEWSLALAETPTRMRAMSDDLQHRLINWGYAVADAALRSYVIGAGQPAPTWPYPDAAPPA
jgi:NTE family protein